MTTQASVPTEEIIKAYREEYYSKQSVARLGFWGKVNSFFKPCDLRGNNDDRFIMRGVLPAFVGIPLGWAAAVIPVLTVPVIAAVMLSASLLSAVSLAVVERQAKKNLKQDIASGTLLLRYTEEILKPQQTRLQNKIESFSQTALAAEKKLSGAFDPKASAMSGVARPAAEKPVPPSVGL